MPKTKTTKKPAKKTAAKKATKKVATKANTAMTEDELREARLAMLDKADNTPVNTPASDPDLEEVGEGAFPDDPNKRVISPADNKREKTVHDFSLKHNARNYTPDMKEAASLAKYIEGRAKKKGYKVEDGDLFNEMVLRASESPANMIARMLEMLFDTHQRRSTTFISKGKPMAPPGPGKRPEPEPVGNPNHRWECPRCNTVQVFNPDDSGCVKCFYFPADEEEFGTYFTDKEITQ